MDEILKMAFAKLEENTNKVSVGKMPACQPRPTYRHDDSMIVCL